ncbi:hypothetical protein ABT115_08825 [Streptomyces sp. NPDC001832]|uniref:hypothetical protein n=1 Tax=Streptomyces sp. NPDC001832 TaxID=3154527 RepID=UPI00332D2561
MKYKNIAVGMIPEDLTNFVVAIEWTPGGQCYRITLLDDTGKPMDGQVYPGTAREPIGYDPKTSDFDMLVWNCLAYNTNFTAQLTRTIAGYAYFEWFSPVDMSRTDRAKFGADK